MKNNRVTEISFSFTGLNGQVGDDFFTLDGLERISIREPNVQIHLDDRMHQWTSLIWISMSGNEITAHLPSLCGVTTLEAVTFFAMDLGGTLPECLKNLPLNRMNFSNSNLDTATLPTFISEMPTLVNLSLVGNNFQGEIPATLCSGEMLFLNLGDNNLVGNIPACLNDSNKLIQLFLDDNQLEGEFPVANLGSNLKILDLGNNNLTGDVSKWPVVPRMDRLELDGNQYTGTFDGSILPSSNFRILRIGHNTFNELINFPDHALISSIDLRNNHFDFSDLEGVIPNGASFVYEEQADIGTEEIRDLNAGEALNLSMNAGGSITKYQWFKDGAEIPGATASDFLIETVNSGDQGFYHCEATHDSFPDLTLKLAPTELRVGSTSLQDIHTSNWRLLSNPVVNEIVLQRQGCTGLASSGKLTLVNSAGAIVQEQEVNGEILTLETGHLPRAFMCSIQLMTAVMVSGR